jgi:DNA repair exonuclease SbcCD ATPase subunit
MYPIIKHIYHLADIHIRKVTSRHDEYYEVFNNLYQILKTDTTNSIIVVCGDILHEKCNYNEISLQVVFDFFENLVNLMDVIIIMGNHDGYTLNDNKRDALKPILDRIKGKHKLYYLRDSGIYHYENIVFGVSSVFDNKFILSKYINSNKIKIALFHGSVTGAVLQNNFIIDKYDRSIEEFEGYDYILLGDIHKFQYLNNRTAYSSSLIQQSHGEELLNHGLIKWNILNGTSQFIRVPNNYGFLTVNIEDGKFKEQYDSTNYPLHIRLRIRYKNTKKKECNKLVKQLLHNNNIYSTVWIEEQRQINSSILKIDTLTNNLMDINSSEYQNKLIYEYYKNDLTTEDFDRLYKLNKDINKDIDLSNNNKIKGIEWQPIRLTFSNMFSYGENNIIDFTKLNGVIGIIAPNHYGKSSILDILLFSLYDKCSKSNIRSDIMNINKSYMRCELIFQINDDIFKIVRQGKTLKKKVKSLRIEVDFYKEIIDDGKYKWDCISGKDRNDTNKIISQFVGTYDDLIMTNISLQKEINFLDLSQSKRIDYLIKLLGIDVFESLYKYAKKSLNEYVGIHKKLTRDYQSINMDTLIDVRSKFENEKTRLSNYISQVQTELDNINDVINCLYIQIVDLGDVSDIAKLNHKDMDSYTHTLLKRKKVYETNINNINNKLSTFKNYTNQEIELITKRNNQYELNKEQQIEDLNNEIIHIMNNKKNTVKVKSYDFLINIKNKKLTKIKKINSIISDNNKQISLLQKKDKATNSEDVYIDPKTCETIINKYNEYQSLLNQYTIKSNKMDDILKSIKELKKVDNDLINYKYNPKCTYCINNPFTKRAKQSKRKLTEERKLYNQLKDELNDMDNQLDLLEQYESKYHDMQTKQKKGDEITKRIMNLENDNKLQLKELEIINMGIEKINEDLTIHEHNKKIQLDNKNIDIQIKRIKDKINNIKLSKDSQYIKMKETIDKVNELKKHLLDEQFKLNKVNDELQKINNNRDRIMQYNKNNNIKVQIKERKRDRQQYIEQLDKAKKNQEKVLIHLYEINTQIRSAFTKNDEINKYDADIKLYRQYTNIMYRNGLPYRLLSSILSNLQNRTNNILSSITDFTIIMERIENKLVSGIEVYKKTNEEVINIQNCSGFEQFIINLSLRLAITSMSNQIRTNWIAIDEGFSCMDSSNLQNVELLLNRLRTKYDFILLISHLDELKSNCDKYINITKTDKDSPSYVRYI